MTRKEFENKLLNKNFTQKELEDLRWGWIEIDDDDIQMEWIDNIESSELDRWSRSVQTIFKYRDEFYGLDWSQGLTELQEDFYYDQPYKVTKQEKQITITEWIPIKED